MSDIGARMVGTLRFAPYESGRPPNGTVRYDDRPGPELHAQRVGFGLLEHVSMDRQHPADLCARHCRP
jgi:hypothetical protein